MRGKGVNFSEGELGVLGCLEEALSNKGIARRLDIAEVTVKARIRSIAAKIGMRGTNRTVIAVWWCQHKPQQTQKKPGQEAMGASSFM